MPRCNDRRSLSLRRQELRDKGRLLPPQCPRRDARGPLVCPSARVRRTIKIRGDDTVLISGVLPIGSIRWDPVPSRMGLTALVNKRRLSVGDQMIEQPLLSILLAPTGIML